MEYMQIPGDILFTPAGWTHEVYNVETSASLTGNFINSTNVNSAKRFWRVLNDEGKVQLLEKARRYTR